ncbi:ASKHA domain-containing protein [Desulfocurvus sp. DL9XJH121]
MSISITDAAGRELRLPADPERTLVQAAYLSGRYETRALCSGLGRCGRCRVRFESPAPLPAPGEDLVLDAAELARGWRLGCRHKALAGTRIFLPAPPMDEAPAAATAAGLDLLLAVDLGTTTVHWRALDAGGREAASGSFLNPQMGAGSEVMSRLAFARSAAGAEVLRGLVLDALRRVAASLPGRAASLAVAGNPAMTLLLLGLPVDGLSAAPYTLDEPGGRFAALGEGLPEAYVPPQLAPFVGGDLSAGLTALSLGPESVRRPFLLADMGTNGEFLLALSDGTQVAASVPLGPALEGAGLACGNVAGPGAVSRFALTPRGLETHCIGGGAPSLAAGITGAGYLSLMALLAEQGVLDSKGGFSAGNTPLARRLAQDLGEEGGEARLDLPGGLYLAASDVEEVLKVKAAFDLACSTLLAEAGLRPSDLGSVCLAGALGEHVAPSDLESLGFIPPGLGARVRAVGNASLDGAALLLASAEARAFAESLPASTRCLDLASRPDFTREFVGRMRLTYG